MTENLPHSCPNCGASMTSTGRLESLLVEREGDYLSYGQLRERLVSTEAELSRLRAENDRPEPDLQMLVKTTHGQGFPVPDFYVSVGDARQLLATIKRLRAERDEFLALLRRAYDAVTKPELVDGEVFLPGLSAGWFRKVQSVLGITDTTKGFNQQQAEITRLRGLLKDVVDSGNIELDDSRLRYVAVQIPRDVWDDLAEFRAVAGGER